MGNWDLTASPGGLPLLQLMDCDNENSVMSGSWWGIKIFNCNGWHQLFTRPLFLFLLLFLSYTGQAKLISAAPQFPPLENNALLVIETGSCKSGRPGCHSDFAALLPSGKFFHLILYYFRVPSIQLLLKSLVEWQHLLPSSQHWH